VSPVWGWIIALLATLALHLGASGWRVGWALGIAGQAVQLAYALLSYRPGFLLVIAATTWGYVVQWREHEKPAQPRPLPRWAWPLAVGSACLIALLAWREFHLWSWGIGFYGASALILGRVYPGAWGLGVLGQVLWLGYGLASQEWGFVAFALGVSSGYLRNWGRARRLRGEADARVLPNP
jgi:hypothetical protein